MAYSAIPLPASPTLTNPDMILPYGEYEDSPPPSPDGQWKGNDLKFSIGDAHTDIGLMTPTTPIIYGQGTTLSDIGEVTEAESIMGRKLPGPAERRLLKQQASANNLPLRSSPTMGNAAGSKKARTGTHQRKVSIESTSTIRSEGRTAKLFEDFDDEASVDDSVFQGDDEESVADSYSQEVIASEMHRLSRKESNIDVPGDMNSSVALSRRAEEILLNAKQRLSNMEGNLTRARSTLHTTSSGSLASIHSSSPLSRSSPSPSENEKRIQAQIGVVPSLHRHTKSPLDSPLGSPGHSRVYSENSLPRSGTRFPVRPASAAASRYADTRESSPQSPDFASAPENHSGLSSTKASPPHANYLEPLDEDGTLPNFAGERVSMMSNVDEGAEHRGLTRSASSMQMRDLQHQMHDLKGRLSVLRDRARDDTMRRRSMQSLRTPSPFTAAEQWYTNAKGYEESLHGVGEAAQATPEEQEQSSSLSPEENIINEQADYASSDSTSIYEDVESLHDTSNLMSGDPPVDEEEEGYDTASEHGFANEAENDIGDDYKEESATGNDEEDDYESDTTQYHDTIVSHEDREDAFDYEHFFLHSAMGTISQQRNRRGSFSSEGSVATTRGPTAPAVTEEELQSSARSPIAHIRSESTDTVSTMATFATAKEEYDEGDEHVDEMFAVQHTQFSPAIDEQANSFKRSTFGPFVSNGTAENYGDDAEPMARRGSVIHVKSLENGHNLQRPSVASISSYNSNESTGTSRSFPLVNTPKTKAPLSSSAPDLRPLQDMLAHTNSSATTHNGAAVNGSGDYQPSSVDMLAREDQILVQRLVASVGKCVLGLEEAGRSSLDARMWRRRLDAARRVLEGWEGAV